MLNKNKRKGASMVEYILLVALIGVALILSLFFLRTSMSTVLSRVTSATNS